MKDLRLFTTSAACALGAAILATTALQSTPAEARGHAGGHTRASAHSGSHKVSSRISQELPGQHSQTSGVGGGGGGGGKHVEVPQTKPHDGGRPVPPGGIPSGPSTPTGGGGKLPKDQTQSPPVLDPGTHPGGTKTFPDGGPKNPGPIPPVVTGPKNPGPIPPVLTPGNVPPGPKPVPPPETNSPPILTGTPTRAPIPPLISGSGSSPGNRIGTTYSAYADVGAGYAPCQWFKTNYDRTGSAYWFNRYRICLWQH
jgi:hypothetical protein